MPCSLVSILSSETSENISRNSASFRNQGSHAFRDTNEKHSPSLKKGIPKQRFAKIQGTWG